MHEATSRAQLILFPRDKWGHSLIYLTMHAPIYLRILPTNFIGIYDMLELTIRPSKGSKMNNNHWPWLVPTCLQFKSCRGQGQFL